jgi:hypothetical protein
MHTFFFMVCNFMWEQQELGHTDATPTARRPTNVKTELMRRWTTFRQRPSTFSRSPIISPAPSSGLSSMFLLRNMSMKDLKIARAPSPPNQAEWLKGLWWKLILHAEFKMTFWGLSVQWYSFLGIVCSVPYTQRKLFSWYEIITLRGTEANSGISRRRKIFVLQLRCVLSIHCAELDVYPVISPTLTG